MIWFDWWISGAECVVCMCDSRDTIILPCRHLCLCNACADSLRYQANNCPICRAPFRALLQVLPLTSELRIRIFSIPDPDPQQISIFNPKKNVSRLSEIWSVTFISVPGFGSLFYPIRHLCRRQFARITNDRDPVGNKISQSTLYWYLDCSQRSNADILIFFYVPETHIMYFTLCCWFLKIPEDFCCSGCFWDIMHVLYPCRWWQGSSTGM